MTRATRLIVAAGGGGDAVAAMMLHAALYGHDDAPALILTYSWDRLVVDPTPGPRSPADFTGLRQLTPSVWAVPPGAAATPPHGSSLPRLAAAMPHTLALIDPRAGVEGITHQLEELTEHLAPDSVDLLDVGGDVLAHGDEPTLRSPLADALTLAACAQVLAPVRLLVAGPGLDGELPADTLRERLGPLVTTFAHEHAAAVSRVLAWHPSEAAALLAATARGVRGRCGIRGAGLPVPLTDESPSLHQADLEGAFTTNGLAVAVADVTSLDEAEHIAREACGFSEIDDERDGAARLAGRSQAKLDPADILTRLGRLEAAASGRGATHLTFRHITEALEVGDDRREELRQLLIARHPEQYEEPLWRVRVSRV